MSAHIHRIQTGMSCAYLVEASGGLVLVDAGGPEADHFILRRIRSLGNKHLKLIYLTHAHFDHYGGAAALRRATGALVAIHRLDADALRHGLTQIGSRRGRGKVVGSALPLAMRLLRPEGLIADILLEDGDVLNACGQEAVVVHTPGHTPGSSSLLLTSEDDEGRAAFVGDLITASRGSRAHAQRFFAQDWDQVWKSIQRIQRLRPQWVYGGHGCRAIPGELLMQLGK